LKPEVIKWAAFYEHRCKLGAKQIFHLEAFVAKYMRIYERYVMAKSDFRTRANLAIVIPWALTSTRRRHVTMTGVLCRILRYMNEITLVSTYWWSKKALRAKSVESARARIQAF
jgi:hypothetical protein